MHTPQKPVGLQPSPERQNGGRAGGAGGTCRVKSPEREPQQEEILAAMVEQLKIEFSEKYSPRLVECGVGNVDDQLELIFDALKTNDSSGGGSGSGEGGLTPQSQPELDDDHGIPTPMADHGSEAHAMVEGMPNSDEVRMFETQDTYSSSQLVTFESTSTEHLKALVASGDVRLLDGDWLVNRWRKSTYMGKWQADEDAANFDPTAANDDDDAAPKAEARSSLMMTLVMDNDLMEHPEHSAPVSHFSDPTQAAEVRPGESKEGHFILPCRQEISEEAFCNPDEICRALSQGEDGAVGEEDLQIVVISYPWLDEKHPDPEGFHLMCIAPVLEIFSLLESKSRGRKVRTAVFWDWSSIWQPSYYPYDSAGTTEDAERVTCTVDQSISYDRSSAAMFHWYCHPRTLVLLQSRRQPGNVVNKTTGEPMLNHGRPIPKHHGGRWHERRLWCKLESLLAEMTKPSHLLLDLGSLYQTVKKWGLNGLPLTRFVDKYVEQADAYKTPESWREMLRIDKYCIGSGELAVDFIRQRETAFLEPIKFDKSGQKLKLKMVSDRRVISQNYRLAFKALFQSDEFTSLNWSGLQWSFDLGVIESSCFVHVGERLTALDLSDNPGLSGELSLFERMTALKKLSLGGCCAFGGDLSAVGDNVGFAANLSSIDLSGCENITGNVTTAFKSLRVIEEVDLSGLPLIEGDIKAFSGPPPPQKRDPVTQELVLLPNLTPQLKVLKLRGCIGLSGDLSSIKSCTNLVVADFNGCRSIEGDITESVTYWRNIETLDLQFTRARGDIAVAFGGVEPKHVRQQQGPSLEETSSRETTPRKLRKLMLFNMKIHGEASFAFGPETTPFLEVLVAKRTGIFVHDAEALRSRLPNCDMVI